MSPNVWMFGQAKSAIFEDWTYAFAEENAP